MTLGERNPDVGIIGCQEWVDGEVLGADLPPDRSAFDGRGIVRGSMLHTIRGFPHSHCLYRMPRHGVPERFYELEYYGVPLLPLDVDAGMRALSGGRYGYVYELLVTTRLHGGSVTATEWTPNHLKMWSELQLIDRWGPVVLDSHDDYRKCRARYLRFYYRYLLLWRVQRKRKLYEQHLEWLRRASAEPSLGHYLSAVLEWPVVRAARRLKPMAVRLGLLPRYFTVS